MQQLAMAKEHADLLGLKIRNKTKQTERGYGKLACSIEIGDLYTTATCNTFSSMLIAVTIVTRCKGCCSIWIHTCG